jgi:putative DNA primase/helicase
LAHVGKQVKKGFVFADHDEAGIRAAEELSFPWVKSDAPGEDANDLHLRAGLRAVRSVLQSAILGKRGGE